MKNYDLDFSIDILSSILWQYDNAEKLKSLINKKHDFFNKQTSKFWEDWYRDVFNIDTANYFGLIVWAIILGCNEYVNLTYKAGSKTFGFGENHKNFHESNFALGSYILSLSESQLRKVVKAQMYNFNSNGSLYDINRLLVNLFPENNPYVKYSAENNVITYYFNPELSEDDLNIVLFSNMLPSIIGVRRRIINGDEE